MLDEKYELRYLPLFYEELDGDTSYIALALEIPMQQIISWTRLQKRY